MICTCIQNKNLEEIFSILEQGDIEMAEIRLDLCPDLDEEDIESLFSGTDIPLIATCRIAGSASMQEAERRLRTAILAGAKYVDVELEAPAPMGKRRAGQPAKAALPSSALTTILTKPLMLRPLRRW